MKWSHVSQGPGCSQPISVVKQTCLDGVSWVAMIEDDLKVRLGQRHSQRSLYQDKRGTGGEEGGRVEEQRKSTTRRRALEATDSR